MSATLEGLAAAVGAALAARGLLLATAESCTGGGIAAAVTDIAGSSGWFDRGFVTYSNQAKCDMLGVAQTTLAYDGAVSTRTAREMAQGALQRSRADLAVAVTGIAGPGGATADKPVGTVCFAWARQHHDTRCETRHFAGDRAAVRAQTTVHALQGVLELLSADPAQG